MPPIGVDAGDEGLTRGGCTLSDAEIYQALAGIFTNVFKRRVELNPALTAPEVPGWDSFRFLSIIMATEDHFHIKLPAADLDEFKNVGDLVRAIARQLDAGDSAAGG